MADNWIQEQTRLRQRRSAKNFEISKGAPFLGFVTGPHDPENETVVVQYHGGTRKLKTMHPYTGSDSWIRAGMEASQSVIMAQRPDSAEPELLSYSFKSPEDRLSAYKDGAGLYRPITPGEIEIHSKGTAQTYYSRRPLLEQRGGLIRQWLNQDELQSGAKSPVHVRNLHLHKTDEVGDEERLGVVQRPDGLITSKFVTADRIIDPIILAKVTSTAAVSGVVPLPGPFAKEHLLVLKSGATLPSPEKLLDVRQGDVIDDEGEVVNLSSSGNPLRYKAEYFTESVLGGAVFLGIDDQGNWSAHFPDEAEVGGDLVIPAGDLLIRLGKNWVNTVENDYTLTCVDGEIHQIAVETEFHVKDGLIEMGAEEASDKAVLDSLIQDELSKISDSFSQFRDEFNNHTHPLQQYIAPSIPLATLPCLPGGPPAPPSEVPTVPSSTQYDPGKTNSELVTIDS